MKLDFALLADAATVDGGGKLNVLGIFDRIRAREFPARHGRVALVLRFAAGPVDTGKHEAVIRLMDPDGGQLLKLDGALQVGAPGPGATGETTRMPHVLNLDGIVFPKAGVYRFEIQVDGELVTTLPLTLQLPPEGPSGSGPTRGPDGIPIFFAPGGPAEA